MINLPEQLEVFPAPRRKGAGSEEFFAICAIDGKFSSQCLTVPYRRPRYVRAFAKKKQGKRIMRSIETANRPGLQAKIRINVSALDKRPICRSHRLANDLNVSATESDLLGPTTIESKLVCPEQFLWFTDNKLKHHLRTTEALVVGSLAHKIIARYAQSGRISERGEHGIIALTNLLATDPKEIGVTHPLADVTPGTLVRIRQKAIAMAQAGIRSGDIQSLAKIAEDPSVVYAEVEHPIKVQLSTLKRELLGDPGPYSIDLTIRGQIDWLIVRWLPGDILEIWIRDNKTRQSLPTEEELDRFETALQMRLYAAWGLWSALTKRGDMPKRINLRVEHIFLTETQSLVNEVPVGQREIRQAIETVEQFIRDEVHAQEKRRKLGDWQKTALELYPPKPGSYCSSCPANGLCTATREKKPGEHWSYIDQILPARKEQKRGQNQAMWF